MKKLFLILSLITPGFMLGSSDKVDNDKEKSDQLDLDARSGNYMKVKSLLKDGVKIKTSIIHTLKRNDCVNEYVYIDKVFNLWKGPSNSFFEDKSCEFVNFKTKLKSNPKLDAYVQGALEMVQQYLIIDLANLIVYKFFIDEVSFGDWIKVCKSDMVSDYNKLLVDDFKPTTSPTRPSSGCLIQ